MKLAQGRVWRYGDHIDTDLIIPARYLTSYDGEILRRYCFVDLDADFASQVQPGDIVVAMEDFGCGSSREHAPLALKACGVHCVIAASFARIFYRNAINIGLPVLECPALAQVVEQGERLEVDISRGWLRRIATGVTYQAESYPDFMQDIINAGGLIAYMQERKWIP